MTHLTFSEPEPLNATKVWIDDFGAKVAEHYRFEPGDPIEPFVKRLGGSIVYQDVTDWLNSESGSIVVEGPDEFTIYLSQFTGPLRDRFTVAHELGHYFLHSDFGKIPITAARNGSTRVEWEANWFAAGFLMPAAEFRKVAKTSSLSSRLAAHFMVSVSAAEIRKTNLGIN